MNLQDRLEVYTQDFVCTLDCIASPQFLEIMTSLDDLNRCAATEFGAALAQVVQYFLGKHT